MTPDQRAAILATLAAHGTVRQAIRGAYGYLPARAMVELRDACATDAALNDAHAAAERREAEGGKPKAKLGAVTERGHRRHAGVDDRAVASESRRERVEAAAVPVAPDWSAATRESVMSERIEVTNATAGAHEPSPFDRLLEVDAACQAYGMPALSPWWLHALDRFYASGKAWGIFLVGRGGGKSSSLERVAASDAYYTARKVHPGQVWTWPFISIGPDDANRRIDGIEAVYRAIGLPFVGDETGELDAKDKPIKVKDGEGIAVVKSPRAAISLLDTRKNAIRLMSVSGTIGNISGPSTVGMTVDEAAKLLDDKNRHVNPLSEIIASGAQTSRGRAGWRAIVCSSAWDKSGTHYGLVRAGDTETNYVARIGDAFLPAALEGFAAVADALEARGDRVAAMIVREHAAPLTADSPEVPTWVANPTLGNHEGAAWSPASAALATLKLAEVLPEALLEGVPRIVFWLRENASVPLKATVAKRGPLSDVVFPVDERGRARLDVAIGVAPPDDGEEWGLVAVGLGGDGSLVIIEDASGDIDGREAAGRVHGLCSNLRASVLAVATDRARRVELEVLAAFAGAGIALAPVAPQAVSDASGLRVGPLRTLYQRARLRHAPDLGPLDDALRAYHAEAPRSPRVEATVAAVTRLVACYPWLQGENGAEPIAGPRSIDSSIGGSDVSRGMAMVRRLGGR